MSDLDIAILGASKVTQGVPAWQASIPVANDNDDVEPFGEIQVFQSLGVTALPYPKDSDGYAECLVARDVGGRSGVALGARDTRSAKIVGKMTPGDTVVHSTGPEQAAQLQLKEKKRQAALATKSSKKKTMMVMLDGKNDKVQITGLGAMIEIDKEGDISIVAKGGAAILLQGGDIYLRGTIHLPGMTPGMCLMQGPPTGTPNTFSTPVPLTPLLGLGQ